MNPNSASAVDDALRERCLLYVLGELNSQEATAFESRLSDSPELAEVLLEISDSVCLAGSLDLSYVEPHASAKRWWKVVGAVAALAACIVIAWVVSVDQTNPIAASPETTEDLLIARAWVGDWFGDEDDIAPDMVDIFESSIEVEVDEEVDDDASLSWMVAAVSAGDPTDG